MHFKFHRKAWSRARVNRMVSLCLLTASAGLLLFVALMLDDVRKEERKLAYMRAEIVSMQASMFLGCQMRDRGQEVSMPNENALHALEQSLPIDI